MILDPGGHVRHAVFDGRVGHHVSGDLLLAEPLLAADFFQHPQQAFGAVAGIVKKFEPEFIGLHFIFAAEGKLRRGPAARDNDHDEIVAVFRNINERHIEEMFAAEQRRHLEEQLEGKGRQIEMTADLLNKQIAEHKQDKLALEHSEMRYTALVENTLTGIYIHDGRKMIYCNDSFAQIFGFDRDCLESMDTDEMFAGGRSIETLLSEMSQEALVKGKTCTGRQIWLKLSRARITCSGQSMVIGNVIDVTEQIETQERLMASELELHTLSAQLMAAQESQR